MPAKTLYINGRFLTQPMTGTNRFAYELSVGLAKRGYPCVVLAPNGPLREDSYDLSSLNIEQVGPFKSHLWEQVTLPWHMRKKKDSLLLSLKGLGPVFMTRQVATIHDMSYLVNPKWFSLPYRLFYRLMTPLMASHVRRLITVSEFSKGEIVRLLKVSPDKVSVIHNAPSGCFRQEGDVRGNTPENDDSTDNFILTVSSLDPRKNLSLVFEAYGKSAQRLPLYVVGERYPVFGKLEVPWNDNIKFLGRISDEELRSYYAHASLFVYPSLYEGFGMPPMEAVACGCRNVVLSDIPVFREVYGDMAHYVKVDDSDALAAMFDTLPEALHPEKISDFIERFTWEESVERLVEVLRNV
ncbi:MAG: glycosyltransferase family 4 protein [Paludibacteraceae bacterium]|nr:glycosyltransferase family 4 protein [Paludibacteraceae bacterium]